MDVLHTDTAQPSGNDNSAASSAAKSDAPDGMLSNLVRFGVAGVCGASTAIINECLGSGNVGADGAGPDYGGGEPDTVKQPKHKRQLGCPGSAPSFQRTKSEKAGKAKRAKEA